jgi:hypothetical protein
MEIASYPQETPPRAKGILIEEVERLPGKGVRHFVRACGWSR